MNAYPSLRINIKHSKIVEPQTTIISPKKVHAAGIAIDSTVVPTTACFFIEVDIDLFPGVGVEGEGVEVV